MSKRIASLALALLLALCASGLAEEVELSAYYGRDIAEAAREIGGLRYVPDEEFPDIYESDALALRGDGTVSVIELKGEGCALRGVRVGMPRSDALGLLEGEPQLWLYDEEAAYMVADDADPSGGVMLVVFFDERGAVDGAWYRSPD